jgi:hypothetical protein
MDPWAALYEQPTALTADWGHHRIFAPLAYRRLTNLVLVPIVHTEAIDLARFFPSCWDMTPAGPVLSVLRALTRDASGIPAAARKAAASLPAALQAYPIVVPSTPDAMAGRILVDKVIAEDPSDIGAPLTMADGKPSRAAAARTRLALKTARTLSQTRELTRFLHDAGLLEPWPLHFELAAGERVDIDNLQVLARSRLDDPKVHRAIATHGIDAALFLSAHRLSLFRISGLLAVARAASTARAGGAAGKARAA